jgi:CxxC motif-containing protein (DUF1111 family)
MREGGQKPHEGVLHAKATREEFQETLSAVQEGLPAISHEDLLQGVFSDDTVQRQNEGDDRRFTLRKRHLELQIRLQGGVAFSQVNTPALFGSGLIDALPDRVLLATEERQRVKLGRVSRLPDGRIGKFGWKGQTATLSDFVQAACANELGLGNPSHPQPRPLGKPKYEAPGLDLTQKQCDQLTAYVASLDRPTERTPVDNQGKLDAVEGKKLFGKIGCADCHAPRLGDIDGIYSDLLLHHMGEDSAGGAGYRGEVIPDMASDTKGGPEPREWRTPPLWGVADSAPYMHDGRAKTLDDAIRMHGGQGEGSATRYRDLGEAKRKCVIAFLSTLRAPETP